MMGPGQTALSKLDFSIGQFGQARKQNNQMTIL